MFDDRSQSNLQDHDLPPIMTAVLANVRADFAGFALAVMP